LRQSSTAQYSTVLVFLVPSPPPPPFNCHLGILATPRLWHMGCAIPLPHRFRNAPYLGFRNAPYPSLSSSFPVYIICICIYVYIYIYIWRERERERDIYHHIHIHVYMMPSRKPHAMKYPNMSKVLKTCLCVWEAVAAAGI